MGIRKLISINNLYYASFTLSIVLLPWSIGWSSICLWAFSIFGLLTTSLATKYDFIKKTPEVLPYGGIYLLYVLGLIYTEHYGEGLVALNQKMTLLVIPIIATTSSKISLSQIRFTMNAFVFSILCLTIWCLARKFFGFGEIGIINFGETLNKQYQILNPDAKAFWMDFTYISLSRPFAPPTFFAIYLTLSVLIISFNLERYSFIKKIIAYSLIVWFSIFIILLSSRLGIVLILLMPPICVFLKYIPLGGFVKLYVILVITMSLVYFISPMAKFRVTQEPFLSELGPPKNESNINSVNVRLVEIQAGLHGIKKAGLFGTGTGGTLSALTEYYKKVNLPNLLYDSHNQFIETTLEIGALGLILLLACFVLPLKHAFTNNQPILFCIVIMAILACITTCFLERARGLFFYCQFVSLFMFSLSSNE